MEALTSKMAQNGVTATVLFVVVLLVVGFLLRNPIKAVMAGFMGYRANLDDYAISIHENRDIVYKNEVAYLTTGLTLKNAGLILIASFGALVSPLIFGGVFLVYKLSLIKEKLAATTDFKIYKDIDEGDEFVDYLNNKQAKINLIVDELTIGSYIMIAVGLYSGSAILVASGLLIIALLLLSTALFIYNGFMYRINYKFVEFYRVMRLIDTSALGKNKSLLALAALSLASNFSPLAGWSVYFWILVGLRGIIGLSITSLLKKEDKQNIRHQEIENRDYVNIENIASYPNPISQSRGYKMTSALQMKFFEIEKKASGKELIYFDDYGYYPQAVNNTDLRKNPLLKAALSKTVKIWLETLDFTKQILILGGMGSGKTAMINHVVQQVIESVFSKFKAIAYNDTKGDFTKDFYREGKDIIVNLYDIRAKVWCPFLEMKFNIEAGTAFISNLFESIAGTEKDFFSASAKQKTAAWLQESFFATDSNINAWEMFFAKIKAYEADLKKRDDRTQSSILATIQIALEILNIMYYQIVIEKRKTFTFTEFVNATDIQLFFVNNKQYEAKLMPYLNGLTATYINTVMAKEDTKEHLILNIFDEFLTMKIDEASRKTLLTATRSKGFCNVLMAQYLINDEKLIQDLDSSRYALIAFNINDDFTLNKVASKIAEAECLVVTSSPKSSEAQNGASGAVNGGSGQAGEGVAFGAMLDIFKAGKGDKYQTSYSLGQVKVVIEQQLQSMPKYHHLTFIPSEETKVLSGYDAKRFFKLMVFGYDKLMSNIAKTNDFLAKESGILYLGYTPQSSLSYDNKSFEKWEMREYYSFNSRKKVEVVKCKYSEAERFNHWYNLKFGESEDGVKKYIKDNKLVDVCLKEIFEGIEEDEIRVELFISKTTEQERLDLMNGFFDCLTIKDKYEFCKAKDLIGCILGIFTFSDEFVAEHLELQDV